LVAGIVEFGAILEVNTATNRLATQYALSWAGCTDIPAPACATEIASYTNAATINNLAPQLKIANLTLTMVEFNITNGAATVYTTAGTSYTGGYPSASNTQIATATPAAVTAAAATESNSTTQWVVVVVAQYNHTLDFFGSFMGQFLNQALTTTYTVAQLKSNP
jgi:hypothetical protein